MPIRISLKYNCLNNVCYDDKAMLFSLVVCIYLKILCFHNIILKGLVYDNEKSKRYNPKGIQGIMFRYEF
ncbi:hypothetical protein OTSGILL_0546 [Orientia tsutsugamushi str. Gilliam]|uniref:Uncharacterized protein n=1 Tax=Orientia tsutsugamushi str. Gilliam TaxID=1359184 RepID=A0A0F3MGL5_ORITS|nr:hypothetical protein OTSGILL_0546 [Orientia tsutsugamushi str. Gilliam]SPR06027.1 Uncharacterised protein [Orientia tsutsugamushi str. Gilliam]